MKIETILLLHNIAICLLLIAVISIAIAVVVK